MRLTDRQKETEMSLTEADLLAIAECDGDDDLTAWIELVRRIELDGYVRVSSPEERDACCYA